MTWIFIANLTAATIIVGLLVAVCRAAFVTATERIDDAAGLEPAVTELERRAA